MWFKLEFGFEILSYIGPKLDFLISIGYFNYKLGGHWTRKPGNDWRFCLIFKKKP